MDKRRRAFEALQAKTGGQGDRFPGSRAKGGREVAAAKTRRALAKLRRAVAAAEATGSTEEAKAALSRWESAFAESVEERLEAYGSAFTDPAKGDLSEPLSIRQAVKVREIARKTKATAKAPGGDAGKAKPRRNTFGGLKSRKAKPSGAERSWVRDVDADLDTAVEETRPGARAPQAGPASFTVVRGGKDR